ncbi:MAG: pyrroloquinoline-quinone synthase PqqC [Magnetovibrionaceae bacterium]
MTELLSPAQLEEKLRAMGDARYHNRHPFHKMLHGGEMTKGQVQAWALNRFCYQAAIPRKDAALMARTMDRELRREWIHRITDHDGEREDEGGIERWLVLTTGLGLDRDDVVSQRLALPATRFAVEAYVRYTYEQPMLQAVASSLTELFAPKIHQERIVGMLEHYDFITDEVMAYFKRRLNQAPVDAEFALRYVKEHARRPDQQDAVCDALSFKLDVLWAQLDALYLAYVEPGMIPPGAFDPATYKSEGS